MRTGKAAGLLVVLAGGWVVVTVWFLTSPARDSLIAYLSAAAALFAFDAFKQPGASIEDQSKHDTELFAKFRKDLPFAPAIRFIATNWLASTFRLSNLNPIDEFRTRWRDAAHEFDSAALNAGLKRLLEAADALMELVGYTTWPIGSSGLQSVKGSPEEDPKVWKERGEALAAAAASVVSAHQALERAGRREVSRRTLGEVVGMVVTVVILSVPAFGLWTAERNRAIGLSQSLSASRAAQDSLTLVITELRSKATGEETTAADAVLRSRVRALGRIIAEGDSIKTKCLYGPYRPIDDASRWLASTQTCVSNNLGEGYAIRFAQAQPRDRSMAFVGVNLSMSALWSEIDGKQACLAEFIKELEGSR